MQKILIEHSSDAGQRIDRFCKKFFPNIALGAIYRLLRTGKIKINGKKKDQSYKLELWDELTLWMSDEEIHAMQAKNGWSTPDNSRVENPSKNWMRDATPMALSILYEDEYLMVINKPAWINVHAWDHKTTESNLIDQVQDYLRGWHDSLTFRPALVHRIDRDTSGCILIAKEKPTLEALLSDLQSHSIEKVYHALVVGFPAENTGTIREKLLRIENARWEAKVRVDATWQSAVTHYRVIQHQSRVTATEWVPHISLLECRIETGRTHQIRVHLAHIGSPILWDKAYGNKKINSFFERNVGISRQMLHAYSLEFIHPITKKRLKIEAPYFPDFTRGVDTIRKQSS